MVARRFRFVIRYAAALALALAALAAQGSAGYASYKPGPQGTCLVRKPVLSWNVQGTGGTRVTGCTMTLNGKQVSASYSSDDGAVIYEPSSPLEPGDYNVQCTIELDGKYKAEQSWKFKVSSTAIDTLPDPDAKQRDAVDAVNEIRRALGLPTYVLDSVLCAASQAHAKFMNVNRVFGHYQKEGMQEFIGTKPIERAQAFGHRGGLWEDVALARETPQGFVYQLFHAPYHRIPFLQPGTVRVGAGFDDRFACIDFGSTQKEGVVVSPAPNQTNIPTSWDGIETPSPLRNYNVKGSVGYVVVFSYFSQDSDGMMLDSATLSLNGEEIPVYINTPSNDDHLKNSILIIPKSELKSGSTYTASVTVRTESGKKLSKTWSFKTK